MPAFDRHVFVCCNQREPGNPRGCCSDKQAAALRERLKDAVAKAGLKPRVRINQAGCLDQCEHGPTMVVYPEAVWYGFVKIEDVDEIVASHLLEGRPLERLRLPPGCINTPTCMHRGGGVQLGMKLKQP